MNMSTMYYSDLQYGEIYTSTKDLTYSIWKKGFPRIEIKEGEKLMFRSFQPYEHDPKGCLSLFVVLETKETVCLYCSQTNATLYLKHLPWEERNKGEQIEA